MDKQLKQYLLIPKVKSETEVIFEAQSPLSYIDGHLSFQECRVGTQTPKM